MSNYSTALSETLVDEWVRGGLRHAVLAPGSRSTPLALALTARAEIATEIVLDERVAAFMALGVALAGGGPGLVLTTSGTATTHLHAAVVEAHLSEVALIVCTADRPPELYGVGAAQTIDQHRLFGTALRAYLDLGVPDAANRMAWRSLAARALLEATGTPAGPVQLNLSFREPLVGDGGARPAGRSGGRPWHRRAQPAPTPPTELVDELVQCWPGRRGVLLAGAGIDDPGPVLGLAARLGWPVLADPRSGCRVLDDVVVAHADAFVRDARWAEALRPELIVSLGASPASKVLATWLASASAVSGDELAGDVDAPVDPAALGEPAEWVVVNRAGSWWDPDRRASMVVASDPAAFAAAVLAALGSSPVPAGWSAAWRDADDATAAALTATLAAEPAEAAPSEPAIARAVYDAAARHGGSALVVSSSMPIRDLEWYAPRLDRGAVAPTVLSNRGANGIDGVIATAAGVAMGRAPETVWLMIGDLAFLHDSNALLNLTRRALRLRLVVIDNGGGGIFSFLPQASLVEPERFERLFGTSQDVDVAALLGLHGIDTRQVTRADALVDALYALATAPAPVAALVLRAASRQDNVAGHDRLHAGVRAALAQLDPGGARRGPELGQS